MSERALRGTRLGATSYETDSGIDLAPRQDVDYICANGHQFAMPFSLEAEVPAVWECRICGAQALRRDGAAPEEKSGKPVRTHWDMLLERRSLAELEEVLAERLNVLRGGGIPFAAAAAMQQAAAASASERSASDQGSAARPAVAAAGRPAVKKTAAKSPAKAAPATRSTPRPARKAPAKSPASKSSAER